MNRRRFLNLLTGFLAALPFVRLGKAEAVEPWGPGPIQRAWDEPTYTIASQTICAIFEWNPKSGAWEQVPEADNQFSGYYFLPDDVPLMDEEYTKALLADVASRTPKSDIEMADAWFLPGDSTFPGLDEATSTGHKES